MIVVFDNTWLLSLGNNSFSECTSLANVTWLGTTSITTLGYNVFRNSSSVRIIDIPTITNWVSDSIGNWLFADSVNLQSVLIKAGNTIIGSHAFAGCPAINTIEFPATVNTIQSNAFRSYNISTNIFPGVSRVRIKGILPPNLFKGYASLLSVTIDNTVNTIGTLLFTYFYRMLLLPFSFRH